MHMESSCGDGELAVLHVRGCGGEPSDRYVMSRTGAFAEDALKDGCVSLLEAEMASALRGWSLGSEMPLGMSLHGVSLVSMYPLVKDGREVRHG